MSLSSIFFFGAQRMAILLSMRREMPFTRCLETVFILEKDKIVSLYQGLLNWLFLLLSPSPLWLESDRKLPSSSLNIYLLNLPAKLPLSYRKVNLTFPFWRMVSILFGLKKLLERVSKMHSSWGWNSAKSDELDGGKWRQWLNVWGCHNKVNYVLLKCSLTKCPISGCAHTAPLTASSPRQLPKLMHWKVT